jgi:hypothetical protein
MDPEEKTPEWYEGQIKMLQGAIEGWRSENARLTAELDKARRYIERLATASVKELTKAKAENAALREWASPILRWVKDVRCTRDTVADLWFWLEAHVRTCPAAIDAGKDGE